MTIAISLANEVAYIAERECASGSGTEDEAYNIAEVLQALVVSCNSI